jgi:hypothetical protein
LIGPWFFIGSSHFTDPLLFIDPLHFTNPLPFNDLRPFRAHWVITLYFHVLFSFIFNQLFFFVLSMLELLQLLTTSSIYPCQSSLTWHSMPDSIYTKHSIIILLHICAVVKKKISGWQKNRNEQIKSNGRNDDRQNALARLLP